MYIITKLCHRYLYNYEAVAKIFVYNYQDVVLHLHNWIKILQVWGAYVYIYTRTHTHTHTHTYIYRMSIVCTVATCILCCNHCVEISDMTVFVGNTEKPVAQIVTDLLCIKPVLYRLKIICIKTLRHDCKQVPVWREQTFRCTSWQQLRSCGRYIVSEIQGHRRRWTGFETAIT